MDIVNIAGYRFVELTNLTTWWDQLRAFCEQAGLKGTITLSVEGININLAGNASQIEQFTTYLDTFSEFEGLKFKVSYSEKVPFRRLRVKIRQELIPVNQPRSTLSYQPKYVAPETLRDWLADGKVTMIDTRNEFEYQMGTFDGAVDMSLQNFRDFPEAAANLDNDLKEQPVVIFCTGGIRCEKAAPVMEQQGFKHVYQLEGGILEYFAACGDAHYHGTCFVFDNRVALNSELQTEN